MDLIRTEMMKQLPVMAEAVRCIRAEGLKTALLSHSSCLLHGGSCRPLDREHFDVVRLGGFQNALLHPPL